jgi:hypothetical protein
MSLRGDSRSRKYALSRFNRRWERRVTDGVDAVALRRPIVDGATVEAP